MVHDQDMAKPDRDMQIQVMLDSLEVFDPRGEDQQAGSERSCETTSFLQIDAHVRCFLSVMVANVHEKNK